MLEAHHPEANRLLLSIECNAAQSIGASTVPPYGVCSVHVDTLLPVRTALPVRTVRFSAEKERLEDDVLEGIPAYVVVLQSIVLSPSPTFSNLWLHNHHDCLTTAHTETLSTTKV